MPFLRPIYTMSGNRLFIIAGEASGDLHASALIKELLLARSDLQITCVGGDKMASSGASILVPSSQLSVVGLFEVFSHVRPIFSAYQRVKGWLKRNRPDLLILVDFPEFNLLMAKYAKALKIPVFYYISPQIWAWRQGRVKKIRAFVDKMAVILPFEEEFYRKFGVNVSFVGHPLLDSINVEAIETDTVKRQLGISVDQTLVCLLPGSRKSEIERHLPIMIEASKRIRARFGETSFFIATNSEVLSLVEGILDGFARDVKEFIHVVEGKTLEAIKASRLCLAASGTVTLESAIIGTPVVVMYKVSRLSYLAGKRLIKVPWISLVNLIAQKRVVPEFIQNDANPENIASCSLQILMDQRVEQEMKRDFREVVKQLGAKGVAKRVAKLVMELLVQKAS